MPSSTSRRAPTIWCGSPPLQMAGSARALTKSLIHALSSLTSEVAFSFVVSIAVTGGHCFHAGRTPLPQFQQKLIGWNIKWIFLKNPAEDDHRMSSHHVNHYLNAEFGEVVGADDRMNRAVVVEPVVICLRLIFQ